MCCNDVIDEVVCLRRVGNKVPPFKVDGNLDRVSSRLSLRTRRCLTLSLAELSMDLISAMCASRSVWEKEKVRGSAPFSQALPGPTLYFDVATYRRNLERRTRRESKTFPFGRLTQPRKTWSSLLPFNVSSAHSSHMHQRHPSGTQCALTLVLFRDVCNLFDASPLLPHRRPNEMIRLAHSGDICSSPQHLTLPTILGIKNGRQVTHKMGDCHINGQGNGSR